MNFIEIKKELYYQCNSYAQERIDNAKNAVEEAQRAANQETKSSAGDKYETGRAMMQLEKEKHTRQLVEALKLKQHLAQINADKVFEVVQPGSLVTTSIGNFFIAISMGKISLAGKAFFIISPDAPIALKLRGLKVGDVLLFRGKELTIELVA